MYLESVHGDGVGREGVQNTKNNEELEAVLHKG